MKIGVLAETRDGERRVALVPDVVRPLTATGHEVLVQKGAGSGALIPDVDYALAGGTIVEGPAAVCVADVVVKVASPTPAEAAGMRAGSVLIGLLEPLTNHAGMRALASAGVTSLAMEGIPRISRAQAMDALSSQATVAGYRAALIGAQELNRFFPGLMTAAGDIPRATVLVLGVGVAGLQALATARRLGALVQGFDVRASVKEEVKSVGARFLEIDLGGDLEGAGGYAKEVTRAQQARLQESLAAAVAKVDVVITTAQVPGRAAPVLVTADAVRKMKPGSVIVDLAAAAGGNCDLSEAGETVVRDGVKILAPLNLPSTMAGHASRLYARNIRALLDLIAARDQLDLDFSDEIIRGACVTRLGQVVGVAAGVTR